jgi:hypothetical protein
MFLRKQARIYSSIKQLKTLRPYSSENVATENGKYISSGFFHYHPLKWALVVRPPNERAEKIVEYTLKYPSVCEEEIVDMFHYMSKDMAEARGHQKHIINVLLHMPKESKTVNDAIPSVLKNLHDSGFIHKDELYYRCLVDRTVNEDKLVEIFREVTTDPNIDPIDGLTLIVKQFTKLNVSLEKVQQVLDYATKNKLVRKTTEINLAPVHKVAIERINSGTANFFGAVVDYFVDRRSETVAIGFYQENLVPFYGGKPPLQLLNLLLSSINKNHSIAFSESTFDFLKQQIERQGYPVEKYLLVNLFEYITKEGFTITKPKHEGYLQFLFEQLIKTKFPVFDLTATEKAIQELVTQSCLSIPDIHHPVVQVLTDKRDIEKFNAYLIVTADIEGKEYIFPVSG